jgi:hypothetical protein
VRATVHHDGFADLFMGYMPHYRVSWNNTLGGLDKAPIVDNDQHWTGGHVSLDPAVVRGAMFCSRPMPPGTEPRLLDVGPTILHRYGLDAESGDMDGTVLPIEGL